MKNTRLITCFGIIILIACLVLAATVILSYQLTRRTEATFGKAVPGLSFRQRKFLEAVLLLNQKQLLNPHQPGGAEVDFTINPGEPTSNILGRMWEAGLIDDPAALSAYLQYTGLDTSLQAGSYTLSSGMSAIEIAYALQDATPASVMFAILPGWRMEEIAAALPTSGLSIDPETFLQVAAELPASNPLSVLLPPQVSAEGFMFPGVYDLPRETTVDELVNIFLDRFEDQLSRKMQDSYDQQGLSLFDAVTLASIVEREAVLDEEKPLIASVFLNRLAAGIPLESDPTAQYAAGYDEARGGWWPTPVSLNDLEIDSPYNTYRYPGLPPGPISNPSTESLKAVAFPAQTPYYYFRASCDGSGKHVFAETYEQHLNNSCP
jgi:UPF0755 protein